MIGTSRIYYATCGALTVQAAAHAATAGFAWLLNPDTNTGVVLVHEIVFRSQLGSALAAPTSPRITVERQNATGAPSGATVAMTEADERNSAASLATLRTASTGLALTAVSVVTEFLPTASATAVAYSPTTEQIWRPPAGLMRRGYLILSPGRALVVRQPDAGTAADTRRFTVQFTLEDRQ